MLPLRLFDLPEDGRVFIQASAGTGKTRVLCDLVIKALAMQRVTVDQILLISFTNASVKDLNVRVKQRLDEVLMQLQLDQPTDKFVMGLLEFSDLPAQVLCQNLQQSWWQIHNLKVSTVHGMCLSFIQQQPEFFGLQPGTIHQIVDGSLQANIMKEYWRNLENYFPNEIVEHILSTTKFDDYQLHSSQINNFQIIQNRGDAEKISADFQQNWEQFHAQCAAFRQSSLVKILKTFEPKPTQVQIIKEFNFLKQWAAGDIDSIENWVKLLNKTTFWKFFQASDVLMPLELIATLNTNIKDLLKSMVRAKFTQVKIDKLFELASENNHIDFESMLIIVANNLIDSKRCELVKHEIGNQFKMLLIDEYQDLQPLQTGIMERIFADCRQICVFDPKQSIYSFQGADVKHLEAQRQQLLAQNRVFDLSSSWRFAQSNQDDINRLFSNCNFLTQSDEIDDNSKQLSILYTPIACASQDRFNLVLQQDGETKQCAGIQHGKFAEKNQCLDEIVHKAVAIAELITHNQLEYTVDGVKQLLCMRDVAILTRNNKQLTQLADLLKIKNLLVSYHSTESVWQVDEIILLSNMLQLIIEDTNIVLLNWAIVTGMFAGLKQNHQSRFAAKDEFDIIQSWAQRQKSVWVQSGMSAVVINCIPLILQQVSSSEYTEAFSNLNQMLEIISQQTNRSTAAHGELFVNHDWQWFTDQINRYNSFGYGLRGNVNKDRKYSLTQEKNLQLMTMHQAKGLEFPMVLVWGTIPDSRFQKIDLAEEKRLAYIALTRAKCYTFVGFKPQTKIYDSLFSTYANAIDIPTILPTINRQAGNALTAKQISYSSESEHLLVPDLQLWSASKNNWARYSYSSLKARQQINQEQSWTTPGDDEIDSMALSITNTESPDFNIWNFPKGRHVGTMLHNVMEWVVGLLLEFKAEHVQQPMPAEKLVEKLTYKVQQSLQYLKIDQNWTDCVVTTIIATLNQPLGEGDRCSIIDSDANNICVEANFTLSLQDNWQNQVAQQLKFSNQDIEKLAIDAHFTGYIDLMIGNYATKQFYIYDFKSDFLGNQLDDYSPNMLQQVVENRGYGVQTLLYSAALARLLRAQNIQDVTIHYGVIFMRGLSSNASANNGIWQRKINQSELLDIL